jgi:hypothetical protein
MNTTVCSIIVSREIAGICGVRQVHAIYRDPHSLVALQTSHRIWPRKRPEAGCSRRPARKKKLTLTSATLKRGVTPWTPYASVPFRPPSPALAGPDSQVGSRSKPRTEKSGPGSGPMSLKTRSAIPQAGIPV